MGRHPKASQKIILLASVLGPSLWKKVIKNLSFHELKKINKILSDKTLTPAEDKTSLIKELLLYLKLYRTERNKSKSLFKFDFILLILFVLAAVTVLLLFIVLEGHNRQELNILLKDFAGCGGATILFFAGFSLFLRKEKQLRIQNLLFPLEKRILPREKQMYNRLIDIISGLIGGLLLFALLSIMNANLTQSSSMPRGIYLIIHLLVGLFFAPLFEESFFRYYVGSSFSIHHGKPAALFWTSAAFALAHQPGTVFEGSVYMISGIILCLLWLKRGNILAPVLAHGFGNLLLFIQGLTLNS